MSMQGRWLVDGRLTTRDSVKSLLSSEGVREVRVMLNKIRLCKGGIRLDSGKEVKFIPVKDERKIPARQPIPGDSLDNQMATLAIARMLTPRATARRETETLEERLDEAEGHTLVEAGEGT